MATVVIIGGGAAGAPAARSLSKKLHPGQRVILIEKEETVINPAVFPLYAVGKRKRGHLSRSRSRLTRRGVKLITGEVQKIDAAKKRVYIHEGEISYDLLLIAAGAVPDRSQPPGAADAAIDLQSLEGVEKLRALLPHFGGAEIAIIVPSTGIKCPAAPYEYALLLENWFQRRGRSRDISITIYTPEEAPLSLFGKRVSETVAGLLLKRRIRVHPAARISKIDGAEKTAVLDGNRFPFDLLLFYAPVMAPPFIEKSGLGDEEGWVRTDPGTMALPGEDSIFAAGDITRIETPSGAPLPKLGAIAHLQSFVAAGNIARLIRGRRPGRTYSGFTG
ncbi:MAG TPA: FAD-dependent oxidoreductase [Firmicutes bacterium]|jgi:sulfide:quinone oxidoreductase|nr:FAD-dependent oxidoreductase [Bacillota bacterium]